MPDEPEAPADTPAPAPTDGARVRIGPSWGCFVHRALVNPLVAPGAVLLFFWHSVAFQHLLYELTDGSPTAREWLIGFYRFGCTHYFPAATWVLVIGMIGYAYARWQVDSYIVADKFLYVTTGLLDRRANTVSLPLIVDCDISQNPLQAMLSAGDLAIRTSEGEKVCLRYVCDATESRDLVLAHTQLENVRMYGRI